MSRCWPGALAAVLSLSACGLVEQEVTSTSDAEAFQARRDSIVCMSCDDDDPSDPGGGGGGGGSGSPSLGAPEALPTRITTWNGNWYLKAWGEWNNDVYADTQWPGEGDESWETWNLVDWNGGLLRNGDSVSLATKQEKEPWYLRAQNGGCTAGAKADTRGHATIDWGIGARETWTIIKVAKPTNSAGDVIRNGDAVAFRSVNGCFLDFIGGTSSKVRVDRTTLDDHTTWRYWQKLLPSETDDFPGHADWCFGGEGAGCWNNPDYNDDSDWAYTSTLEGVGSIKTIAVEAGSIAHDNCCRRRPLGKACGGVFTGNEYAPIVGKRPGKGTMALAIFEVWAHDWCESEWQKAIDDHLGGKRWTKTFGPYVSKNACPNCQTRGKDGWGYPSDQLFKRATPRDTWMPHLSRTWPGYWGNPYDGFNETTYHLFPGSGLSEPTSLMAPGGQKIAAGDEDFCQSGSAHHSWFDWWCDP